MSDVVLVFLTSETATDKFQILALFLTNESFSLIFGDFLRDCLVSFKI